MRALSADNTRLHTRSPTWVSWVSIGRFDNRRPSAGLSVDARGWGSAALLTQAKEVGHRRRRERRAHSFAMIWANSRRANPLRGREHKSYLW